MGWTDRRRSKHQQGTVNYTYDTANRRATMTPASQAQIVYTFDAANRLTNIVQGTQTVVIGYDTANRRTTLTLPNGVVTTYGYDNANEVTGIIYKNSGGTTLGSVGYTYDAAGQRLTGTGGFGTDLLPTPTTGTNAFDVNNRQTMWNGFSLGYDANGDPQTNNGSSPATTYAFDARHRVTSMVQNGSTIASFSYDVFNRRASKTIGSTATSFLYDGQNAVQGTQGSTISAILTGLGIDERFPRTETAGTRYFETDALGSTIALTDTGGAVQQTYDYEPYGEVTATGSSSNPYQYTGRENDGTGLYYYRARYYSPSLKRFISEDPMGLDAGLNEYAYADGDPLDEIDPLGLEGYGSWSNPQYIVPPPDSCGCGKGERGWSKNPGGTNNPGKGWKDDPNNAGWGWQKDPQTGKPKYKKRPRWLTPPEPSKFCPGDVPTPKWWWYPLAILGAGIGIALGTLGAGS
jgi:RHS repeat-associated protein